MGRKVALNNWRTTWEFFNKINKLIWGNTTTWHQSFLWVPWISAFYLAMIKLISWKLGLRSFLRATNFERIPWNIITSSAIISLSLPSAHLLKTPLHSHNFFTGVCHLKTDRNLEAQQDCKSPSLLLQHHFPYQVLISQPGDLML